MEQKIEYIINNSIDYNDFLDKIKNEFKNEFGSVKVTEDKIKIIGKYDEEYWMLREFYIEDIKNKIKSLT